MNLPQRTVEYRVDDFLLWEQAQPERHEFVDGEVFAMVGVSDAHAAVALNLSAALLPHVRGKACRLYPSDMKLAVDAANCIFYPDLFVSCDSRDQGRDAAYVKRHPLLVIEILSKSTEAYDRGAKFSAYRSLTSLQEYVLVSPRLRTVEVFRRDATGHWVLYPFTEADGTFEFASIGFTGRFDSLFEGLEAIEDTAGTAPTEGAGG